jgi:hypothetical protein
MKISLHTLSVIFVVLLSSCSPFSQKITTPTLDAVPTAFSIKTPSQAATTDAPNVTLIVQTPSQDHNALLSQLLPNCSDAELSPSQTWATGFCNNDETWVVSIDQQAKWSVSYNEYYGKKFDSDNGMMEPYHWTLDNKFLDLAIQPFSLTLGGASIPFYYHDGWGLVRLDLANGNLADILGPIQQHYYSFSFSPDGKSIAYILQPATPLTVKVMNLESNEVKSYSLKPEYNRAGDILWSPDMTKLVLGQAIINMAPDFEPDPNIFSIVLINLGDNSRQLVISDNLLFTRPVKWLDENRIELLDEDAKYWIFNLTDQTLVEWAQ